MIEGFYLLILLPAFSFSLFLVELLRRHAYQAVGSPLPFSLALTLGAGLIVIQWAVYSFYLSGFGPMDLRRALRIDCLCHMPLVLSLSYVALPVGRIVNLGTFLFFSSLTGFLVCRVSVLLYYRRSPLARLFSRRCVVLAAVLAVAAVLRVSLIATNRFHGDEALYCYWALLIASGKDVFLRYGVIVDKPPVFLYTLALFFRVFGHSETAARLPNILASLAGILIVYHIALQLTDARVALLSAVFLTLSPFDIQFAPTAFTDPLMVCLILTSCFLALRRCQLLAGLAAGLAVMTKPTGVIFLPLPLFFAALAWSAEWRSKRFGFALLAMAVGTSAILLAVFCWDVVIRVNAVNFLTASASRYGGLRVVPWERVVPRLEGWLRQLQYLTGSNALNALLVIGVPVVLGYSLHKRRVRPGWALDLALTAFFVYFVAVHTVISFSIWDRYMLGLAPVAAILLARVVLLPDDALLQPQQRPMRSRVAYLAALVVFLLAALLPPTQVALRYGFPVGGDHGAFQGIDSVARYFRANAAPGSIVFHKWLGWHYSFYMFGLSLDYYYYPDHAFVLETCRRLPDLEKYIVFPSWTSEAELQGVLNDGGWELNELYRTYRADGTLSFTIYRIEPISP